MTVSCHAYNHILPLKNKIFYGLHCFLLFVTTLLCHINVAAGNLECPLALVKAGLGTRLMPFPRKIKAVTQLDCIYQKFFLLQTSTVAHAIYDDF